MTIILTCNYRKIVNDVRKICIKKKKNNLESGNTPIYKYKIYIYQIYFHRTFLNFIHRIIILIEKKNIVINNK